MNWDLGEQRRGGSINSRERNITGNLQKKAHAQERSGNRNWKDKLGPDCRRPGKPEFKCKELGIKQNTK